MEMKTKLKLWSKSRTKVEKGEENHNCFNLCEEIKAVAGILLKNEKYYSNDSSVVLLKVKEDDKFVIFFPAKLKMPKYVVTIEWQAYWAQDFLKENI